MREKNRKVKGSEKKRVRKSSEAKEWTERKGKRAKGRQGMRE